MKAFMRLLVMFLISLPNLAIADSCNDTCRALRDAEKRRVTGFGPADPRMVCFRLLMWDNDAAVILTVSYLDGKTYKETFPRGAVRRMAGPKGLPMMCVGAERLRNADHAEICTDGGSTMLFRSHIESLLAQKSVPQSQPACLRGTTWCQ